MTPAAANDPARSGRRSFTLPRAYRLKRRRLIRPLFDRDQEDVRVIRCGSIRALYRLVMRTDEIGAPLQVGVFVGRRAGTAVRRNRIRRRIREAYRRRHPELLAAVAGRADLLTLALVFHGRPDVRWPVLVSDIDQVVNRLLGDIR